MGCRGPAEMLGGKGLALYLGFLALLFSGCHAPEPSSTYIGNPPVYVWPLGNETLGLELKTNVREYGSVAIQHAPGPSALDYNAMTFSQDNGSYIDIPIPQDLAIPTRLNGDNAFSFHLYPENDGTVFHYKSDDVSEEGLTEIEIQVVSGTFVTTITSNEGLNSTRTPDINPAYNTWQRIVIERDLSNAKIKFYVDSIDTNTDFDPWLQHKQTIFPGKLRLGGSQDGNDFFTGRVACVQLVNTKNPQFPTEYDAECAKQNWPTTTSTTSSTRTPTTITTSTTTQTTTSATSTTSITTSTSTAPSTTTVTSTTTATSTAKPPASTTTTPTTTTMAILQASTITPTTSTTTTLLKPPPSVLHPAVPAISTDRSHFSATQNATYQSISDILLQTTMLDLRACVWLCVRDGDCGSFVYSSLRVCQIGVSSPAMASDVDKTMYTLQ